MRGTIGKIITLIVLPVAFVVGEPAVHAADAAPIHVHLVQKGQTLYSIARRYGVPLAEIASLNGIRNPSKILAGTRLIVPVDPENASALLPALPWPVDGRLVSRYGRPRRTHRHQGIDIGASRGTPIHAVADGVVKTVSEKQGDYGRLVTIEHDDNLVSYYGHNMKNLVVPGQRVTAGTIIALVGHTGNASGDHLHFELRVEGVPFDPLLALAPPVTARNRVRSAATDAPAAQR